MKLPSPKPCGLLFKPVSWLPQRLHSAGLALVLNRLLADLLAEGGLDFLQGKTLHLVLSDIDIHYRLRFAQRRCAPAEEGADVDVRFTGSLHTFLLLATRREDADSLFFRRLLRIEGDTATGLHLKNFIDALDELPVPGMLREALERFADRYARYCAGDASTPQPFQVRPASPRQ